LAHYFSRGEAALSSLFYFIILLGYGLHLSFFNLL
jgi:hypothetical protein